MVLPNPFPHVPDGADSIPKDDVYVPDFIYTTFNAPSYHSALAEKLQYIHDSDIPRARLIEMVYKTVYTAAVQHKLNAAGEEMLHQTCDGIRKFETNYLNLNIYIFFNCLFIFSYHIK